MSLKVNSWVTQVHETARSKGWWDKPRTDDEIKMLMVTEVAEATECVRNGEPPIHFGKTGLSSAGPLENYYTKPSENNRKPEGELIEIVDCAIRIGDYFGRKQWNLVEYIHPNPETRGVLTPRDEISFIELTFLHNVADSFFDQPPLAIHMELVRNICFGVDDAGTRYGLGRAMALIVAYADQNGWELEDAIQMKMAYNEKRSYRHGGKLA